MKSVLALALALTVAAQPGLAGGAQDAVPGWAAPAPEPSTQTPAPAPVPEPAAAAWPPVTTSPDRVVLHLKSGEDLDARLVAVANGRSLHPRLQAAKPSALVARPPSPAPSRADKLSGLGGGLLIGALGTAVASIVLYNSAVTEVERTRTVEPICLEQMWGRACRQEPYQETYTETDVDFGLLLLGMASGAASAGLMISGIIVTVKAGRLRDREARTAGQPLPEASVAFTRAF